MLRAGCDLYDIRQVRNLNGSRRKTERRTPVPELISPVSSPSPDSAVGFNRNDMFVTSSDIDYVDKVGDLDGNRAEDVLACLPGIMIVAPCPNCSVVL